MTIVIILVCLLAFILLITWGKVNAFLAFLIISIITGLWLGIPLNRISRSVQTGIGDTLSSLVIIIALGAMLGKLVAESGAAQKISTTLVNSFGKKNIQWALMITGFIVGIPLFYNVGFVLLVPLLFSVVYQFRLPAIYTGLPMLAALSVTHGFLPPHPSPTALVGQFNANLGVTLLYGIAIAIPAILIAGPLFSKSIRHIQSTPLEVFTAKPMAEEKLPGTFSSFFASLLPVILLIAGTVYIFAVRPSGRPKEIAEFLSDPVIVMLFSLAIATWMLWLGNGGSMKQIMDHYGEALKDVSIILMIVAGAGALKQVFIDSGVSTQIATALQSWPVHPLILAWLMAAVIRVCIGSATVAGLTAAGILAPAVAQTSTDPNLMVLSIGAGSLMFSHVNDSGFWMFKEYFNVTVKETLMSWSVMETIVSIVGLIGVLVINAFI